MSGSIQQTKSWDEKLGEPHSHRFPLLCPPWQLLMLHSAVTTERKTHFLVSSSVSSSSQSKYTGLTGLWEYCSSVREMICHAGAHFDVVKKAGLCTDWLAPQLGPQTPPLCLMGKRHSAAGMCVSNYIKAIFTSILMGVLVVVSGIVCSDGLKLQDHFYLIFSCYPWGRTYNLETCVFPVWSDSQ